MKVPTRILGHLSRLALCSLGPVAASLSGCGNGVSVIARPVVGPSGGRAWDITCRGGRGRCFDKAGALCENGYKLIDAESHTTTTIVQRTPGGANAYNIRGSELLIECKDGSEDDEPRTQTEARDDEAAAAIQKHPKFPELGATRPEAKAICAHERSQWVDQGAKVGCQFRGANLFVCEVGEGEAIRACTHWKLGADLTDERDNIADTNGKPTSAGVGERGFRMYTWELTNKTITVTGYPAGVIVTEKAVTADADTSARDPK
jgi:hypothetical protein